MKVVMTGAGGFEVEGTAKGWLQPQRARRPPRGAHKGITEIVELRSSDGRATAA